MFLLQRRKDGKYWRNRSSYCQWDKEKVEAEWVTDPALCKPFATIGGAKHSRGASVPLPFKQPQEHGDHPAWRDYYAKLNQWYSPNNSFRKAGFEKLYAIIEVKVKVME